MFNIKVLSLFDGMACGMLAMIGGGISVESYHAYEIDKYAIQTATHNFPQIVECGDVFEADFSKHKDIDFLIGGSPCTHWSIAQTKHRETEASGIGWELFSQYAKALREVKPKYFIYENNKSMSKAIRDSITETFGFDAICINSALVSAQNRRRLYWVGKRNEDGTYSKVNVQQPEDRGILIRDILDGAIDFSLEYETLSDEYYKGGLEGDLIGMIENISVCRNGKQPSQQYRVYSCDGKSVCVDTDQRKHYIIPVKNTLIKNCVVNTSRQVGALPRPNGELSTSQAFRVYDINAKSVTLKAGGGGAGGKTGLYAVPTEFENGVLTKATSSSDGKTYTVYSVVNGIIVIKGKEYPIKLQDGYYIIRKLTISECKRLQTVPEWYEFPVSNAQAYKMLGNGWTVDVITHLIKSCLK